MTDSNDQAGKDGIVVIGSGMAGYTLLREIRKLDKDIALTLICADSGDFYSKPMLSNALAAGKTAAQLVTQPAATICASLEVTLVANTHIERIDSAQQRVFSADQHWDYSALVLATGADPIRLPLEGDGADSVLRVNHIDDYRLFRAQLEQAQQVSIIGPGLIGCEFANDLVASGKQARVIGPDPWPISNLLPEAVGAFLRERLEQAGVNLQLAQTVTRIDKADSGFTLTLNNGATQHSDLVLSAIGLRANTTLAHSAGLETGRGYVVNSQLKTNVAGIYALGDCAEVNGYHLPYIMPLMAAARALAKTLTGVATNAVYPAMPVAIKTPACPLVVAPAPSGSVGEWQIETSADGVRALFKQGDSLLGFALAGDVAKEKQVLSKQLPALF